MIFKGDNGDSGPGGDLNGFVDRGSQLHGELRFENSFRVDGKVTGNIVSTGDLVVGNGGEIDADVKVGRIFVNGVVRGSVTASQQVQIAAGGKVFADLETPSLVIDGGAHFEGHCSMARPQGKSGTSVPGGGAKKPARPAEQRRVGGGPQLVSVRPANKS